MRFNKDPKRLRPARSGRRRSGIRSQGSAGRSATTLRRVLPTGSWCPKTAPRTWAASVLLRRLRVLVLPLVILIDRGRLINRDAPLGGARIGRIGRARGHEPDRHEHMVGHLVGGARGGGGGGGD